MEAHAVRSAVEHVFRAEARMGLIVRSESFNSKLRDELLNGEIFYTLREAQILIGR